jgi:RNA polymerase sigma factor (sigma-70 family)
MSQVSRLPADLPGSEDGRGPPRQGPATESRAPADAARDGLFAEFQPLVSRLVRTYGAPGLAEDLPGEIYCAFCALLDAYDPARGVPLRPYLVRMLTAAAYTYSRRRRRQSVREKTYDDLPERPGHLHTPDGSGASDARLDTEKLLTQLPHLLAALPPRQRAVLIYRYYEELDYDTIATRLEIRPATARSLLRYAIARLQENLAGAVPGAAVPQGEVTL